MGEGGGKTNLYRLFGVAMTSKVSMVSLDKAIRQKRCLTGNGENSKAIPPIWCPLLAPLTQTRFHGVSKKPSGKADQPA